MDPHEQRAFFEQQGYLIVPSLLNSREVAQCQHEIQRLHQLAADLEANQDPLSSHFQREPFSKDQNRNGLPVLRKIENTRALSPCFAQLAAHPRLVAIVQSLLGDDWGLQEWGHIAQKQGAPLTNREDIDSARQIDVPLAAGSAVLFHSLMVHGSGPNQTDRSRNTALYAYFSPHVRYVPKANGPQSKSFPVIAGLDGAAEHVLVAS